MVNYFERSALLVLVRDFFLREDDFDRRRVVIRDELCVAKLVDERFAAASKVVHIERTNGSATNADRNASAALAFSLCKCDQCLLRRVLRDGVRYGPRLI